MVPELENVSEFRTLIKNYALSKTICLTSTFLVGEKPVHCLQEAVHFCSPISCGLPIKRDPTKALWSRNTLIPPSLSSPIGIEMDNFSPPPGNSTDREMP